MASIELAACGSSGRKMATFGAWEDRVLEHCFDQVEWISLHTYLNNYADDTPAFLASSDAMDSFIEEVVAIADAVAARRRSRKRIMLSFDEWNVWYRTRRPREARVKPGWPVAPPILEEVYDMQDALAFGGAAISLLNHADRVRCACLAQLVNVIAPIMTETGGPAWRQTIFWPFADFSRFGRGRRAAAEINSPTYAARYNDPHGPIDEHFEIPAAPYLKLAAVHDDRAGTLTLFALNRSLDAALPLRLDAGGFGTLAVKQALQLCRQRPQGDQYPRPTRPYCATAAGRRAHERSNGRGVAGARPRGTSSSLRLDGCRNANRQGRGAAAGYVVRIGVSRAAPPRSPRRRSSSSSIIASNARFASSPPAASASVSTRGVICQETPHLSLHQPHALSWPPLPTIAFQ